nr:hypothetical protein [Tanacetum cinerariifolium]
MNRSTPIDTEKPLLKDPDGEDVDVHTYRSMIGSLMYLTSSRPDIMFTVHVALSSVKSLKRMLHVTNILSAGYITTPQIVLNSTCLTRIKNWLVQIKRSLVNDVTRLQALVDKKKVIITEATIRDAIRLDDAEGIDCLPNEEIFTELSRMGYEKPSTKLTFYKAFFSPQWNLVRNVDSSTKFYMYLRFLQLMIRAQVGDLSSHTTKNSSPALTQKVFANMGRVGKGFSGINTPLFKGMLVAYQVDESAVEVNVDNVPAAGVADEGVAGVNVDDKIAQALEITKLKQRVKKLERKNKLKVSKLRRLKKVGTTQRVDTSDDTVMDDVSKQRRIIASMDADVDVTLKDVAEIAKEVAIDVVIEESADVQGRQTESQAQIYQIDLEHADKVLSMQDDKVETAKLQEVVEVVTTAKLITEVVTGASATIIAAAPTLTTAAAPTLTTAAAPTLTTAPSAARRRKGVVIRDPEETATPSTIIYSEAKSKDKGKWILVEEPKAQIKQDEAFVRELEAEANKTINWDDVIDQVQRKKKEDNGMKYDDICPIFEKYFNSNVAFLEKIREQIEEQDSKALKRISESQEDKATKKQKLDEEVAELKRHL